MRRRTSPAGLALAITRVQLAFLVLIAWVGSGAATALQGQSPSADVDTPSLAGKAGTVELPREVYDRLIDAAREPATIFKPAPVSWALGKAVLDVNVDEQGSARVKAQVRLNVLENGWALVPVLGPGTAVDQAEINGSPIQLVTTSHGLAWSTERQGNYELSLSYRVDALASQDGLSLALPVPPASSIVLSGSLPGAHPDLAIIPSAGRKIELAGDRTRFNATLPATQGVQLSWRRGVDRGHSLSRAMYRGKLRSGALRFEGTLTVELFTDDPLALDLLPRDVTLQQVTVDGVEASILTHSRHFATLVQGRGKHTIRAEFEVPLGTGDGPPNVRVQIPSVPVSSFELELPGKKEVTVVPASSVETRAGSNGNTLAVAHVPMTEAVTIGWTEAVPEAIRAETRSSAALYHAAHAEEGVLFVRALVDLDVTRGETGTVTLEVPVGVQVAAVEAPAGGVVDWRLDEAGPDGYRDLTVFLDRKLRGAMALEVRYDRSLPQEEAAQLSLPLLRSADAQRQRGMIALLQSRDLTLEPLADDTVTRVGENQLPAHVRDALELTVAHTFKYVEDPPTLAVRAQRPERRQGRFDVQVDSLVSLGDVTLEGSSTLEVDVKSGSLSDLSLNLPPETHLLSLSGPSVRQHQIEETDDGSVVSIEFTQEMEGQFRIEVGWERILADGEPRVPVPIPSVNGAEVEQGRLAVEALSAVEVQPAKVTALTALDVAELPRRLVLRTTNPILHAYKYVGSDRNLVLGVTRHQVVEVQEAAIDQAHYQTLYTRDGLAVTRARFTVRNSREQFLRLQLPEGSEIWSAFVDGKPEKPARTQDDNGPWHLIQIIHQTRPFPVEVIYETPAAPIQGLGRVRGSLPRPKILVTQTRWDVFVPQGVEYRTPRGTMDVVSAAEPVAEQEMAGLKSSPTTNDQNLDPLHLVVPTAGIRFTFEKLYANQGDDEIGFEIPFATGIGGSLGRFGMFLGTMVLWLGLALALKGHRRLGLVVGGLGLLLIAALAYRFQVEAGAAITLSAVIATVWVGSYLWRQRPSRSGLTPR